MVAMSGFRHRQKGAELSQVGDVVVDDGGVANGQARDVLVPQELVAQDARLPADDAGCSERTTDEADTFLPKLAPTPGRQQVRHSCMPDCVTPLWHRVLRRT